MVIGSALIQEFEGKERVIYYLSRRLIDAEPLFSNRKIMFMPIFFMHQVETLFAIGQMHCYM